MESNLLMLDGQFRSWSSNARCDLTHQHSQTHAFSTEVIANRSQRDVLLGPILSLCSKMIRQRVHGLFYETLMSPFRILSTSSSPQLDNDA
ncbi:hypothetical protein KIN20_003721 [Parelaphostrongylus tenuis]|uniref:Uncharacterized protein n=1 Tax=Parelaphostrongylus tenuis TaxID=148309 RepID=A0AAD5MIU9_PARTN|nr:hypothetical protein KIN20_003721 [Parelaphostrongylus tenuis]